MKLKNVCALGLSLMLLLTGCNPSDGTNDNGNNGDTSTEIFDVDLPTEIPAIEGDSVQIHYKRTDDKYQPRPSSLW